MISPLAPELAMYSQCTLSVHHPLPPVMTEGVGVGVRMRRLDGVELREEVL